MVKIQHIVPDFSLFSFSLKSINFKEAGAACLICCGFPARTQNSANTPRMLNKYLLNGPSIKITTVKKISINILFMLIFESFKIFLFWLSITSHQLHQTQYLKRAVISLCSEYLGRPWLGDFRVSRSVGWGHLVGFHRHLVRWV